MRLFTVTEAGELVEYKEQSFGEQHHEEAIETWLEGSPECIVEDGSLLIIGRQVSTRSGPLDLLGIDKLGNLVIVELKRDLLPREALTQAIDYASDVATWSIDKVSEACASHTGKNLEELMQETFSDIDLENININETQRVLLVGFSVEPALERMVSWLSSSYGVSINAVVLHYIRTDGGEELLTRTAIISEEVEQEHIKRKRFQIPMSDEPGTYDPEELRRLLVDYLTQDYATTRLVCEDLLPLLLERESISRQALVQELINRGKADSARSAGFSLTSLSRILGIAKNVECLSCSAPALRLRAR